MLCPYIRSSSANQYDFCEMRYTFEYLFGFKSESGKKAVQGTVFHKVQELRAQASKAIRAKKKVFEDDNFGLVKVSDATNLMGSLDRCWDYYVNKNKELEFKPLDKDQIAKWLIDTHENWPQYDPLNLNVIATEQYFDIPIKKDWAKYSGTIKGKEYSGHLHIKGTMDIVVELSEGVYELVDYKGLPISTKIPTPYGFTTMGELKIGDIVFDQYGNQCKITNKSEQKFKTCYQILFDDKSEVVCDDEHYWTLSDNSVVQIKDLKIGDKINVSKPINCGDDIDLPIDPYVLGIWLGDGRVRGAEIASADSFIFEEIERRGFKCGKNISGYKNAKCKQRTIHGLSSLLRENNLINNKHIPKIYLRASYKQRLDLLRGLMDSDGSVNVCRKQCIFTNCNKTLSNNVCELLLTLGQRPLLNKTKTSCQIKDFSGTAYPISFRPININPFLLQTKRDKININWGPGKSDKRIITKINKIDKKLTQCITVDSNDNTYLCTEKFIPTHNSGAYRSDFATGKEKTLEYLQNDTQLLLYLIALKNKWPDKHWIMSLFFIRVGGLFSVVGDDAMLDRAWKMLEDKFTSISQCESPQQFDPTNKDWRCRNLCPFAKQESYTRGLSICQHFKNKIDRKGLQAVQDEFVDEKRLFNYQDGGGRSNDD